MSYEHIGFLPKLLKSAKGREPLEKDSNTTVAFKNLYTTFTQILIPKFSQQLKTKINPKSLFYLYIKTLK